VSLSGTNACVDTTETVLRTDSRNIIVDKETALQNPSVEVMYTAMYVLMYMRMYLNTYLRTVASK